MGLIGTTGKTAAELLDANDGCCGALSNAGSSLGCLILRALIIQLLPSLVGTSDLAAVDVARNEVAADEGKDDEDGENTEGHPAAQVREVGEELTPAGWHVTPGLGSVQKRLRLASRSVCHTVGDNFNPA